jgi:2-polyprenyl-3-methyl-5-hydroxy-6-metoxy-1,4-benzoquinol methylase
MPTAKLNTYFNDFVLRQRSFYETVAALAYFRNDRSKFLNLGYIGMVPVSILPEDKGDESAMNLYFKTIEGVDIKKITSVLEIGCGRGGGCYILKKYYQIKDVSGIDMTYFNLLNARRNTQHMGIDYEHLNILDVINKARKKYDLIVSVDTTQTYQDFTGFLQNIKLLMKETSILAYSDFAFFDDIEEFKKILNSNCFEILQFEDLTEEMQRAISTGDPNDKKLPAWQRILLDKKLQRYLVWSSSEIDSLLYSKKLRYIKLLARVQQ